MSHVSFYTVTKIGNTGLGNVMDPRPSVCVFIVESTAEFPGFPVIKYVKRKCL